MSKVLELLGIISVAIAGLFAALRSGLIGPRAIPYSADGDTQGRVDDVEEAHGEQVEKIKKSASAVRNADANELAGKFDSAFGSVSKVDPFESRSDE